jgi:hypothetical protein
VTEETKRGGLPPVDLSGDLGPPTTVPNRAAGLAGLVRRTTPPPATPEPAPDPPGRAEGGLQASPPADAPPAVTRPKTAPSRSASKPQLTTDNEEQSLAERGKQPTTLYVSAGLQGRFEKYRRAARGRTNTTVTLEAITALRPRLREILADSQLSPQVGGDLFPSDPAQVRYAGMGSVQIQISPTYAQLRVLDELTAELGFSRRATWIAPVLNAFLPGRRESGRTSS